MADLLGISASYQNLIERNQRPLSAALIVRLAERFDFDPRTLGAAEPAGGADALRRRLADPIFADLSVDRDEVGEWLAAAPGGAEAFARAYDRLGDGGIAAAPDAPDPGVEARRAIEHWRNHFADLDAAAEALADELRLAGEDLHGALAERLRGRHRLSVRILPVEIMATRLRRLDYHARQLQLSELLGPASRSFALAGQLASLEARAEIDALVKGAGLTDRTAERLLCRHLTGYFAAAVMMPYARFLRACETSGYDVALLARRFGASVEQVAHRLTTLHRVGARGLPFFMIRVDRAGQVSKRYAGASGSSLVESTPPCPLWALYEAFARDRAVTQLVELEDGSRWFTQAYAVHARGERSAGVAARFAIGLGVAAAHAASLAAMREVSPAAKPIGLGCRACTRPDCPQRSRPPAGRAMLVPEHEAGLSPFGFAGD